MKDFRKIGVVAALFAALAGPHAMAAGEPVEPRLVSVSGEGEIRTAPDEVSLLLRVVRNDPKPADARRLMAATAAEVIAALRKMNVPARSIQTTESSLQAQYRYDRGDRALTGYSASTTITVKLDKVKAYDEVVTQALESGANELAGVNFSHSRLGEFEKEARKKAVEDAAEKARLLAEAAGARIGRVHRISEETAGPVPPFRALSAMRGAEGEPLPSIAEGEIVVRATVRVSWELLD